ncbi:hypothetical protein WINTERMUTE_41 [Mycobacterium phage Wintermute]|uniref:Uncharacterized protein n=1 Tax=Mycobacterium phage Wintermute TaxID=2015891 RepID=A0A222ZT85_9CAUD|nr:hypothetical protein WINTERMUTE_41 [Mycobacterium phage Wintermute]
MNVGELKRAIAELPDDMPVLIAGETGASDHPNLYVVPATIKHFTHGNWVMEGHARLSPTSCRDLEHTTALLLSEWGNDDGENITPSHDWPTVIEGELADG